MVAGRPTESDPCQLQGDHLSKPTTLGAILSPSDDNVDQSILSGSPGKRGPLEFFNLPRSAWIRLQFQKVNSHTSHKYFVVSYPSDPLILCLDIVTEPPPTQSKFPNVTQTYRFVIWLAYFLLAGVSSTTDRCCNIPFPSPFVYLKPMSKHKVTVPTAASATRTMRAMP
ncbi:hypothetical protein L596_021387 [Steinernema carpocapsae]|uniref:Uncharacterized protein n=1 Tax=Steinernema carpocapsae TaxID=34508 RepID=A0A4U5MJF3_STECR|nr:hypothetical protein L596_021387 [Steinernema carpocapsae]